MKAMLDEMRTERYAGTALAPPWASCGPTMVNHHEPSWSMGPTRGPRPARSVRLHFPPFRQFHQIHLGCGPVELFAKL
jgi:hypothetical protein